MKNILLSGLILISICYNTYSQSNKAYAITGQKTANFNWVDIREIDLATGNLTKTIYESGKTPFSLTSSSKKNKSDKFSPTQNLVAAAAFDYKHNKLFFMPLRGSELSWIDLNNKKDKLNFFTSESQLPNINFALEANNITRMAIGADGNGYALTNDGNHLIQFSTGNNVTIRDLGNLIDGDENKGLSVHNKSSSWGGDIVGDTYGNLYLFTASHNVYIIDTRTRIATYKGSIQNLPGTFTTNGTAVDKNDNVIVSSANNFDGFYKVNMNDLKATKLETSGQVYNASDLANGNLLFQSKSINDLQSGHINPDEVKGNKFINIYPNPVTGNECKISFDKIKPGKYNLLLTDIQGRTITNKQIFVKGGSQVERIQLKNKPASGMYLIKIADDNQKSVFADKIIFN